MNLRISRHFLLPKTADLDLAELGELAGEILNVNPGASVDIRRVFVREQEWFHSWGVMPEKTSELYGGAPFSNFN